jgi:hypothetical protein
VFPVSAFLTEKETKDEKIFNLISGMMLVIGYGSFRK